MLAGTIVKNPFIGLLNGEPLTDRQIVLLHFPLFSLIEIRIDDPWHCIK